MDGSQIEYFSDEFNELCTQVGAEAVAANNPLGAGDLGSNGFSFLFGCLFGILVIWVNLVF